MPRTTRTSFLTVPGWPYFQVGIAGFGTDIGQLKRNSISGLLAWLHPKTAHHEWSLATRLQWELTSRLPAKICTLGVVPQRPPSSRSMAVILFLDSGKEDPPSSSQR